MSPLGINLYRDKILNPDLVQLLTENNYASQVLYSGWQLGSICYQRLLSIEKTMGI